MGYEVPETNVAAPVCCSAWFGVLLDMRCCHATGAYKPRRFVSLLKSSNSLASANALIALSLP